MIQGNKEWRRLFQMFDYNLEEYPESEEDIEEEIQFGSGHVTEHSDDQSDDTIKFSTPTTNSTMDSSWINYSTQRMKNLNLLSESESNNSFSSFMSTPILHSKLEHESDVELSEISMNHEFSLEVFPLYFRRGDTAKQILCIHELLSKSPLDFDQLFERIVPSIESDSLKVILDMFSRKGFVIKKENKYYSS